MLTLKTNQLKTALSLHRTINGLVFTPREGFEEDFQLCIIGREGKERFILSTSQHSDCRFKMNYKSILLSTSIILRQKIHRNICYGAN